MVTELFVSDELPILVNVFEAPLIVLLVSVCIPVNVATVESIAIVVGADPLKLVPVRPVPIVSVLVVLAVIVAEPPNATVDPLNVTELFVNAELGMLVNVLLDPLIDLFVNV